MKTTRFSRDTHLEKIDQGLFRVQIDTGWWVIRGPNGGYVAALLQRAAEMHVADPTRLPRSLTIHYLWPPTEGEAEISVTTERSGRTLSSLSIRMSQGNQVCAIGVACLAESRKGLEINNITMPNVPEAISLEKAESIIPIHQRYDQRYIENFHTDQGAAQIGVAAWIRLAETQELDYPLLAAYSDALRPSVFSMDAEREVIGPVPTVDLTIHYRSDPAKLDLEPDAFVLAVCRSRFAKDGYVEEDGEIWSPCGTLLLQSRQLAVMVST
jgi:acyl-CoA thioesterase